MGNVSFQAWPTRNLYFTTRMLFSRLYDGFAMASVAGCAMFTKISGSSLATATAVLRYGKNKGLAFGRSRGQRHAEFLDTAKHSYDSLRSFHGEIRLAIADAGHPSRLIVGIYLHGDGLDLGEAKP